MRRLVAVLALCIGLAAACEDSKPAPPTQAPSSTATPRALPEKVVIRDEPQEIGLADPAFDALPGAKAYFGRLGGTVYQIEVPDDWNGRLVLYQHGFQGLAPEAEVNTPGLRGHLIRNGYAWGASSYSSTALIPGRAADETAALWDEFAERFGRPQYTYVTGHSMGGAASHIAAERYADRYDGVLALCGYAGQNAITEIIGDYLFAGAYVAGVTQEEFDTLPIDVVINERIRPALRESTAHEAWVNIMLDLTGGERAHDREGFALEEGTNWDRAQILVATGLAYNEGREYNLGPLAGSPRQDFNSNIIRKKPALPEQIENFNEGNEITGDLQVKMLTMHTTGDWQTPIDQQQILRQRVDGAGKSDLLVQRVVREAGHCNFLDREWEEGFDDLVAWVEDGVKPAGEDVLVADLKQTGAEFTRAPRLGSDAADAIAGADQRVTVRGRVTRNGVPLTFAFMWVEVEGDGLRRLCGFGGAPPDDGRYERVLAGAAEVEGCGAPGQRIRVAAYIEDEVYFSRDSVPWPAGGGEVTLDADFTDAERLPEEDDVTVVYGGVFDAAGGRMPPGTKIEAFINGTLCGVTTLPPSVLLFQNPDLYDILVANPSVIPACERGATVIFKINGQDAAETTIHKIEGDGVNLDLSLR